MADRNDQRTAPGAGPIDFEHCVLGHSDEDLPLRSRADNQAAALALVSQARRTLELFSHDLEPALYDQPPLLSALRELALRSRYSRVRILLKDSRRAVRDGHRLVELARHLSSFVQIRRAHEDVRDHPETFLIADATGTLHRTLATRYEGIANFKAPLYARQLGQWFNEVWERSAADPELRRLHL